MPGRNSQLRLWRAMRIQRSFTKAGLQLATESTADATRYFFRWLTEAGYLRRRGDRFVLVRDTGPKAPKILYIENVRGLKKKVAGVYDRNTDTGYGLNGNPPPPLERPTPVVHPRPWRERKAIAQ